MPRKQYVADLKAASSVPDFGNVKGVKPGDEDGFFNFIFVHPRSGKGDNITAMIDVADYPRQHSYILFAADNASAATANALADLPNFQGKPLQEALPLLSAFLTSRTATGGPQDPLQVDSDGDYEMHSSQEQEPESDDDEVDHDYWPDDEPARGHSDVNNRAATDREACQSLSRARADLVRVKEAGFKVGVLGSLANGCYVSIACRVAKLGISEEAQDAWVLQPSDYVVLLMYFPYGYRDIAYFEAVDDNIARTRLDIRVGISNTYKPRSNAEAADAFNAKSTDAERDTTTSDPAETTAFRESFISRPLNELFKERFILILRCRLAAGLSWTGAEKYYHEMRGASGTTSKFADFSYAVQDSAPSTLPAIVTNDQMRTASSTQLSLPLLAMQFLMRHFVRCTEFCLVCHNKLESEVEAIKPYVCDSSLCLYQYMSLGFGPSIEHEIIAQPYVVDLLISFCYASALSKNLHSYPDGLALSVPDQVESIQGSQVCQSTPDMHSFPIVPATAQETREAKPIIEKVQCRFDGDSCDLVFKNDGSRCPLKNGQWIAMNPENQPHQSWHCRVTDTFVYPTVRVSSPIVLTSERSTDGTMPSPPMGWCDVTVFGYDKSINEFSDDSARENLCSIIVMLLDLLPPVLEIKSYLTQHPQASLNRWKNRISPASLGILRWIIASNRACLLQVDTFDSGEPSKKRVEDKVQGMTGWLQFRFAMGAPDKEQRFINSINAESATQVHPTLFAWHGSPLHNWHSIIREGLHFKKTSNGRAYGNGVYHAKDFSVSGGYSGISHGRYGAASTWPQSVIQASQAIALNEIVNAPNQYISQNPYYVVAQLDWIQTRYLFVKPLAEVKVVEPKAPKVFLSQDPSRTPTGPTSQPLALPPTAIPKSRRKVALAMMTGAELLEIGNRTAYNGLTPPPSTKPTAASKKRAAADAASLKERVRKRLTPGTLQSLAGPLSSVTRSIGDDNESVVTDVEDLDILVDPESSSATAPPESKTPMRRIHKPSEPLLPFQIKSLSKLPLTPAPTYATSAASKRLAKDFGMLAKTQVAAIDEGTLWDLGWYVDPEQTDNLYQWIVELHSFPKSLPLAKDMEKSGQQSVVMEIRFHHAYPMSPPFVRVIRPRFLPFGMGGGGHVTGGGSICMELLTNNGWSVASSMESVLVQVRMAMMNLEPRPARMQSVASETPRRGGGGNDQDYGVFEAVDAFKRVCAAHGWQVPEGLAEIQASANAIPQGFPPV